MRTLLALKPSCYGLVRMIRSDLIFCSSLGDDLPGWNVIHHECWRCKSANNVTRSASSFLLNKQILSPDSLTCQTSGPSLHANTDACRGFYPMTSVKAPMKRILASHLVALPGGP